jgi:signal peptidase II
MRYRSFALAAAIVGLDQLSKAWVVAEVPLGARVASWGGILHLTHTRNSGAAFGLLRDRTFELGAFSVSGVQVLGLVSLVVAVALAAWLARSRTLAPFTRLALGAVMGGAIGNGVDRWRLGYVTDFLHAQRGWFDFPVFNVADIGISVGASVLLLATFLGGRHHPASTPVGGSAAAGQGEPEAPGPRATDLHGADGAAAPAAGGSEAPGRGGTDPRPGEGDRPSATTGAPTPEAREDGIDEADGLSDAPARSANDR